MAETTVDVAPVPSINTHQGGSMADAVGKKVTAGDKSSGWKTASGSGSQADPQADASSPVLLSLASQLEYYFSTTNLSRDTYLRTIMDLNSGYVPSSILATFQAVNRIVSQQYDIPSGSPEVATLVERAALGCSNLLDVVTLDTDGNVVPPAKQEIKEETSSPKAASLPAGGEESATTNKFDDSGGASDERSLESTAPSTSPSDEGDGHSHTAQPQQSRVRLIGIGPRNGEPIEPDQLSGFQQTGRKAAAPSPPYAEEAAQSRSSTPPVETSAPAQEQEQRPQRSTVIIRDMPKNTTEGDIRGILSFDSCPSIVDVKADVGNCWFVTLESTGSSKDAIINTLLELRSKSFKGEPIKARLKTESAVAKTAVYPTPASPPPSPHTYRSTIGVSGGGNRGATVSPAGNSGRGPSRYGNQIYAGDRANFSHGEKQPANNQQQQRKQYGGSSNSNSGSRGGTSDRFQRGGRPSPRPYDGGSSEGGRGSGGGFDRNGSKFGKGRREGAGRGGGGGGGIGIGPATSPRPRKHVEPAPAPSAEPMPPAPPLLDSHFPALPVEKKADGLEVPSLAEEKRETKSEKESAEKAKTASGAKDETAVPSQSPSALAATEPVSKGGSETAPNDSNGASSPSQSEPKKPAIAGYAAALLKAAPPKSNPPTQAPAASKQQSSKAQPSKPQSSKPQPASGGASCSPSKQKFRNPQKQKGGNNTKKEQASSVSGESGRTATATAAAAGRMAQSSSVPVVEDKKAKEPPQKATAPAAVAPSWGGGRTFADVLKKTNEGTVTEDGSDTSSK